jgi:hypothetical protein
MLIHSRLVAERESAKLAFLAYEALLIFLVAIQAALFVIRVE